MIIPRYHHLQYLVTSIRQFDLFFELYSWIIGWNNHVVCSFSWIFDNLSNFYTIASQLDSIDVVVCNFSHMHILSWNLHMGKKHQNLPSCFNIYQHSKAARKNWKGSWTPLLIILIYWLDGNQFLLIHI